VADKEHRLHDELQKQLAARDALTKEIQRLRELTGQHEHVVVYVSVSELSLTKVRESNVIVDGVDTELLKRSGIGGVLGAGILDEREEMGKARRHERCNETIGFRVIDSEDLLSELMTALKKAGALNVLAEPVLATTSGRPASFSAGGEFPILVPQSNGQSTIEYRKFGTQLDCVPIVLGNSRIRLEVRPSVSEIDADCRIVVGGVTVPGLRVRGLDTAVEMNVGQTLVLAGLLQKRGPKKGEIASEPAKAASEQRGVVPDPAHQPDAEPDENPIEVVELVVTVRTEFLDVPKVARRVSAE
jgi:Flp pilus assembly secretin CpaC